MATLPYFVFSPNTLLSVLGLLRGDDKTRPTPAENWRDASVDVVIPAFNEEKHIVLCLASVLRQTLRPRRIVLVDDGSSDATAARARAFCEFHGVELTLVQRRQSIGKTPTIKQQVRGLDSDVIFVLDADTVLESDNYIRRMVLELYQGIGIASACGMVLPLRERDRLEFEGQAAVQTFIEAFPTHRTDFHKSRMRRFASGVTNTYREVLYHFLQRFIYRGQMALFGTTFNPVGCSVAYRRRYLEALFDHFEPLLGDDLTNSEDIFIGLAMLNEGYRNVQLTDVCARTVEPEVQRLPKQLQLWSSSFLQSAFYFDTLLKSPFKTYKRWRHRRRGPDSIGPRPPQQQRLLPEYAANRLELATAAAGSAPSASAAVPASPSSVARASAISPAIDAQWPSLEATGGADSTRTDRRRIQEPYRQAFGRHHTIDYGRPVGWSLLASVIEKVFFPTALLMMVLFRSWEALLVTIGAETFLSLIALMLVMKGRRLEFLFKGILVAPIRYALLMTELVTIGRFAADLWLTKNRRWRK